MAEQRPSAVIYHFSPAYLQFISEIVDRAGYEPRRTDGFISAFRMINARTGLVITTNESLRSVPGSIVVDRRPLGLVRTANELHRPCGVLVDTVAMFGSKDMPDPKYGGEVLATGEHEGMDLHERYLQAMRPDAETETLVTETLVRWLGNMQINQ